MHIIVILDENNGMMFNHRRQSKDRILREHILEMTQNSRLWMNTFSSGQFDSEIPLQISEDCLKLAEQGDFCLIENIPLADHIDKIEKLYVFKWNRSYPYDRQLDLNLREWRLESTEEFPGHSHETITKEVYTR